MSIRKGFAEAACVKASEARNFRKSRRLGSLMKSPLYLSFQRLDAHDVSVVVNVPDANRICRIIDPCSSIVRIGFEHLLVDPSLGPWIESQKAAPMQLARPHFAVFVGHRLVKCDVRNRRIIFRDAAGSGIQSEEHSASPTEPRVSIQVETSASGGGDGSTRVQFPHFTALGVEQSKDAGSGLAAGPVAAVGAEDVVVSAVDPLEREMLHDFAIAAVDFHDSVIFRFPHVAFRVDMKIAEPWRIDRAVGFNMELLELLRLRIEPREIMRPVFRKPNDILLVHPNPMSAGQRAWRIGHAILLDCARSGIQLTYIRTSVCRIPNVALGVAMHVMRRKKLPGQLVFGHHDTSRDTTRRRQIVQRRVLRVRAAHSREPLRYDLQFLADGTACTAAALRAGFSNIDQRRSGAGHHPADDAAPSRFVVARAKDLLIGVTTESAR